jgi:hypothetical protein
VSEGKLDAKLVVLPERVSHRRRVQLTLDEGAAGEVQVSGLWSVVISDLPVDRALPVWGERMEEEGLADRWRVVGVDCRPELVVASTEQAGQVMVDWARLMFADVDAIGSWNHEDATDGKADFLFWGRDAANIASRVGADTLDGQFGWWDLPVEEAVRRGMAVEELRIGDIKFATDFRPHSDHYALMALVRSSATESGTLLVGGAQLCGFMTSWGDGVFPVLRDLGPAGELVRIRIKLGGG